MQQQMGFTPEALLKRPHLEPELQWYLGAFYDVSHGRQYTMGGAAPIPMSELLAYMRIYRIDSIEERDWFVRLMGLLDAAYLKHQHEKQAREK